MENEQITAFLFIKVKARKSGHVVELLRKNYKEFKEAAAVYAETDVVARVAASRARIGEILLDLLQGTIHVYDQEHNISDTFEVNAIRPFLVDGAIHLEGSNSETILGESIYAYVVIEVDEKQGTRSQVLQDLRQCEGIIYTACLVKRARIIAKVKAPNKLAFDNSIMRQIQAISGVATTRSHLVINDMYFVRIEESKEATSSPLHNLSAWVARKGS